MAYVKIGELLEKIQSAFKLVLVAAKRSAELNAGAPKMVKTNSTKIASISIEEIMQDKINYRKKDSK